MSFYLSLGRNRTTFAETIIKSEQEKTCIMTFANTKGADESVLSLISTFVVRYVNNLIHCFYIQHAKPRPSSCSCESFLVEYTEDPFCRETPQIYDKICFKL